MLPRTMPADHTSTVLYELIADLRRRHPGRPATRTLDLVSELGLTHDNLKQALRHVSEQPLPVGGVDLLQELKARANEAGVDDLHLPRPSWEAEQAAEAIDPGQVGIAVILGLTALVGLGLALMVAIVHST